MDFNDIQIIWDSQKSTRIYTIDEEALGRNIKSKSFKFDMQILVRDLVGSAVMLFFGVFSFFNGAFSYPAKYETSWQDYWYLLLVSACFLFAAGYLWYGNVKARKKEASFEPTIHGNLKRAIWKTERQIKLINNEIWWCLLPVAIAASVFIYNTSSDIPLWSRYVIFITVAAGAYWIDRWWVRKMYIPKKKEYESLLKKLVNDTGVTNSQE